MSNPIIIDLDVNDPEISGCRSFKQGVQDTFMSMNLCIGSYHCRSTTLESRPQHKNTHPRCTFSAAGDRKTLLAGSFDIIKLPV